MSPRGSRPLALGLVALGLGCVCPFGPDCAEVDGDGDGAYTPYDCDDADPTVHPGAEEVCNDVDDDCDDTVDNGFNLDGDGWTECGGDCDDLDEDIHPGVNEDCDGVDQDCNGTVDDMTDVDGDGWDTCAGDCNEQRPDIHPGAPESCNGLDDDCDNVIDEDLDLDGDGFLVCVDDCDDADPGVNPGVFEECDGDDEDCDGFVDEGYDVDGDAFTSCGGDCDDFDDEAHPGAVEVCDEVDQDCDGGLGVPDGDGDGVGPCDGDCDDADPAIGPGAVEACDGVDQDCDGSVDEEVPVGDTVCVTGGWFSMGCNAAEDPACADDERPNHEVEVSSFEIDRLEVTQAEFAACIADGMCDDPGCGYDPAATPDLPVACVPWDQAAFYCDLQGGRLPTEAEWEKAARGADGRVYPWGSDAPACGDGRATFGGCDGGPTAVGGRPAGASAFGAEDMAGNVWEWVWDGYDPLYYETTPAIDPQGPDVTDFRVARGGGWEDPAEELRTSNRRGDVDLAASDVDVGFRCAYDVP